MALMPALDLTTLFEVILSCGAYIQHFLRILYPYIPFSPYLFTTFPFTNGPFPIWNGPCIHFEPSPHRTPRF